MSNKERWTTLSKKYNGDKGIIFSDDDCKVTNLLGTPLYDKIIKDNLINPMTNATTEQDGYLWALVNHYYNTDKNISFDKIKYIINYEKESIDVYKKAEDRAYWDTVTSDSYYINQTTGLNTDYNPYKIIQEKIGKEVKESQDGRVFNPDGQIGDIIGSEPIILATPFNESDIITRNSYDFFELYGLPKYENYQKGNSRTYGSYLPIRLRVANNLDSPNILKGRTGSGFYDSSNEDTEAGDLGLEFILPWKNSEIRDTVNVSIRKKQWWGNKNHIVDMMKDEVYKAFSNSKGGLGNFTENVIANYLYLDYNTDSLQKQLSLNFILPITQNSHYVSSSWCDTVRKFLGALQGQVYPKSILGLSNGLFNLQLGNLYYGFKGYITGVDYTFSEELVTGQDGSTFPLKIEGTINFVNLFTYTWLNDREDDVFDFERFNLSKNPAILFGEYGNSNDLHDIWADEIKSEDNINYDVVTDKIKMDLIQKGKEEFSDTLYDENYILSIDRINNIAKDYFSKNSIVDDVFGMYDWKGNLDTNVFYSDEYKIFNSKYPSLYKDGNIGMGLPIGMSFNFNKLLTNTTNQNDMVSKVTNIVNNKKYNNGINILSNTFKPVLSSINGTTQGLLNILNNCNRIISIEKSTKYRYNDIKRQIPQIKSMISNSNDLDSFINVINAVNWYTYGLTNDITNLMDICNNENNQEKTSMGYIGNFMGLTANNGIMELCRLNKVKDN